MPKKLAKKTAREIISLELEIGGRHVRRVVLYEAAQARIAGREEIERLKKLVRKQAAEIRQLRAAAKRR